MIRILGKAALVGATALALTQVGAVPAAVASHACPSGTSFTGATTGTVPPAYSAARRTSVSGLTTVALASTSPTAYMRVLDSGCSLLCASYEACVVTYTGTLYVEVHNPTESSVTFAVAAISAPASTGSGCSTVSGVPACVNVSTGGEIFSQPVYSVQTFTAATHTVVGTVDAYRFPLPTGGSVVIPCVVVTVNGATENPCADADGEFVSRTATLVSDEVDQPGASLGAPLATVRVCTAAVTVTAAGFGVEEFPAITLC